ncbi:hypothetical protein [Vibrio sp. 10N.239.312.D08]|uniref:hypothetical protein n=1 Tax=Vibrio sp. 10N.239.312.D08 TaxID=3229978 RepID=UPI003553F928
MNMSHTTLDVVNIDRDMLVALIREYVAKGRTTFIYNGEKQQIHVGDAESLKEPVAQQYFKKTDVTWTLSGVHDALMVLSLLTMTDEIEVEFLDSQMLIRKCCSETINGEKESIILEPKSSMEMMPAYLVLIMLFSFAAAIGSTIYAYKVKDQLANGSSPEREALMVEVSAFQDDIAALENAERLGDVNIQILPTDVEVDKK